MNDRLFVSSRSKLNRVISITSILMRTKGRVTARQWAERFGVNRRTIYRDISYLRERLPELFRGVA